MAYYKQMVVHCCIKCISNVFIVVVSKFRWIHILEIQDINRKKSTKFLLFFAPFDP